MPRWQALSTCIKLVNIRQPGRQVSARCADTGSLTGSTCRQHVLIQRNILFYCFAKPQGKRWGSVGIIVVALAARYLVAAQAQGTAVSLQLHLRLIGGSLAGPTGCLGLGCGWGGRLAGRALQATDRPKESMSKS
jgi:hypothetical protein